MEREEIEKRIRNRDETVLELLSLPKLSFRQKQQLKSTLRNQKALRERLREQERKDR